MAYQQPMTEAEWEESRTGAGVFAEDYGTVTNYQEYLQGLYSQNFPDTTINGQTYSALLDVGEAGPLNPVAGDPAAAQSQWPQLQGQIVTGPNGLPYAPKAALESIAAQTNTGFWNGPGPFLLAVGATGAFLAPAVAAGATGFNAAAADAAGLAQMAADAGLTGTAADAFVASGGTLGSTAAGGGGVAGINGWEVFDAPQQFANTTTTTAGPQPMLDVPPVEGPPPAGELTAPNMLQPAPSLTSGVSTEGMWSPNIEHAFPASLSSGSGAGALALDFAGGMFGGNAAGAPGGSLVDDLIGWGKNNPMLASTIAGQGFGLIKGAMAPTPEEQARAFADARAKIDEANRMATRIPPARWPKPTGRVLRTPGQLPPGLINRAMVTR